MPNKPGGLLIGLGLCAWAWSACSVDDRNPDTLSSGVVDVPGAGASTAAPAPSAAPQSAPPVEQTSAQNNSAAPSSFECPGASASCSGTTPSCQTGSKRCNGTRVQSCAGDGSWLDLAVPCTECVPLDIGCAGNTSRVCSALGAWVDQPCTNPTPVCVPETGACVCQAGSCGTGGQCAASGRCEFLPGDCPNGFSVTLVVPEQNVAIVRVRFDPDNSADVLLQNISRNHITYAAQRYQLCNGAGNCVYLGETQPLELDVGGLVALRIPNTLPSGGELAVVLNEADVPFTCDAYVAWGNGATSRSFESMASSQLPLWKTGERIVVQPGDTGFVASGDSNSASGFLSCNPGND